MPRSKEHNPYQLPFVFEPRRDNLIYSIPTGTFTDADSREANVGRFVKEVQGQVVVRTPADAADYLMQQVYVPFAECTQEELYTLLLNTKNHLLYQAMIYRGTVNQVNIRMAELFREAVRYNAPSIILAHNHPSGSAEESPEDVRVTSLAVEAGRILDIQIIDHLIIGDGTFTSLRERNLGFELPQRL